MVETVEQMIQRRRLLEEVGGKVKEQQAEELKERTALRQKTAGRFVKRVESVRLPKSRPRITYKKSRKIGRAITGVLGALVPPEAMAGAVTYTKGKKGDRGRGRPHGTYKARYVPGIGTVRVPTHIYRKMMSAAKSKRRLAEAERQAGIQQKYEAEQIAMQQDPRFQQAQTDSDFLESPDMEHEARLAGIREQQIYQQQVEQQRQPSQFGQQVGQRLKVGVGNLINQYRQRNYEMQQRIRQRQIEQGEQPYSTKLNTQPSLLSSQQVGQQFARSTSPQIRIISDKSSILNTPNIFNNPKNDTILFNRRY